MTLVPVIFSEKTGRLWADAYDRAVWFEAGKWLVDHTPPVSAYPPVTTFLFGFDHLASMWFEPDRQIIIYLAVFSLEMMVILFLVFKILLDLLPLRLSNYAFLLLLPPTLYFTYNRFDILPAFLCLLAYQIALTRRWVVVSIILAVATLTKWYPALLFPGFLMYALAIEAKFPWKMIFSFIATGLLLMLPAYLMGGVDTLLAPYQYHMVRGMEYTALPGLINNLLRQLLPAGVVLPYFFAFFLGLQVCGPGLILFTKINTPARLIDYSIVVTGLFVLFSRIWSPQWFLWLLPFLILSTKEIKIAALIVVYNVITYFCFPVIFDYYGSASYQLLVSSLLAYAVLIFFIGRSVKNLNSAPRRN